MSSQVREEVHERYTDKVNPNERGRSPSAVITIQDPYSGIEFPHLVPDGITQVSHGKAPRGGEKEANQQGKGTDRRRAVDIS